MLRKSSLERGRPGSWLGVVVICAAAFGPSAARSDDEGTEPPDRPGQTSVLPEMVVTGAREPESRYAVSSAVTSTKTDTALLELPQATSVVPRAQLDDQGVRKLDEALRNVAGVTVGGYYPDWDYYRIRGFDAAFTTFLDGLRVANGGGMNEETFGLERIEVVKGPVSALYGQASLGGMVNLVSKHPRAERFAYAQFTAGNYSFYEPAFDVNAPLNASKSVYFRLNGLYRDQGSFVDFAEKARGYVAPALTWEIGRDTTVTFLTAYQKDYGNLAFPLPAKGTVLPNVNGEIPISRSTAAPDANGVDEWHAQGGYELAHRFNDTFSARQNLRYSWYSQTWDRILYSSSLLDDERTLLRYPFSVPHDTWDNLAIDSALEARFATASITHTAAAGVDYYRYDSDATWEQIDYEDPSQYLPLDLFAPVYGPTPQPPLATHLENRNDDLGLYFQDQARLLDGLTLTFGGRGDFTSSRDDTDGAVAKADDSAFSPRVGLTYEFVEGAAIYGNYSRSFSPQPGFLDAGGRQVEPETGTNYEAGVKALLLDGRVSAYLAGYQLTRKNVATTDPANPLVYLVTGEQRSRGVEVESALYLLPGWDFTAAYSYIDAVITEDTTLPVGARTPGVPKNSFSVWTRYLLQSGPLQGLGAGLGGSFYSSQEGDLANTFRLPSYGLMDAALYFERGRFRSQVNVYNMLDKRYFVGSYDEFYVLPGAPVTFRASVAWMF